MQMGRFVESEGGEVGYVDRTGEIAMIAVQGPRAVALLGDLTGGETDGIGRFHAGEATLDSERISRGADGLHR